MRKAGIATVAASGNEFFTGYVNSPACISAAVAVGSTGRADAVSAFSNQSAKVALMAPGENIISALPVGKYGPESGTSMAAPHVAGAFAMLRQAVPNATVDQIIKALADTGVPVTRDGITKPRIDLLGAFNELTNVQADAAPR